jgi:hypothetical protein
MSVTSISPQKYYDVRHSINTTPRTNNPHFITYSIHNGLRQSFHFYVVPCIQSGEIKKDVVTTTTATTTTRTIHLRVQVSTKCSDVFRRLNNLCRTEKLQQQRPLPEAELKLCMAGIWRGRETRLSYVAVIQYA